MTSQTNNANAAEQTLPYRGDITSIAAWEDHLFVTSVHPEGQPTAVFRLKLDLGKYTEIALPSGGVFLAVYKGELFITTDSGEIYRGTHKGKDFDDFGEKLESPARCIVPLSGDRWAVLTASTVLVKDDKGAVLQSLELSAEGTALTASPDGNWLVAGNIEGRVFVYECEDEAREGNTFALSESDQLHQGRVTALSFEPDELRFYSAGADNKLLLTHARGRLEPENRGGNGNHDKLVTALIPGVGERFYTGSKDRTLKAWQRGSNRRPATMKDGTGASVGLAVAALNKRPHLVQACDDGSIRLFPLDAEGKIEERVRVYKGAMEWAKGQLNSKEVKDRKAALKTLARWNDAPAIDLLAVRAEKDADHELKVLAADLLGGSGNPRAVKHLEKLLRVKQEAVRMKALKGLRALEGEENLRPLKLALDVGRADIGKAAVGGLRALAKKDDQAFTLLIQALEKNPYDVRRAALMSLEALHPGKSPAANLRGLRSNQTDIRRLALTRLYQRKMLNLPEVQSALRQHGEDGDSGVRQVAYLVSVMAPPKLATLLRSHDAELHRQLHELEQAEKSGKPTEPPKLKPAPIKGLKDADHAPLLQAMSSRALDTCLRGAWGLALLGDSRAFGTLLQLSRERDAGARRETCRALQRLGDRRAIERLRLMLRDGDLAVRDAAFSALADLRGDEPLAVAEAGLAAEHEDVRKRALQVLVEHLRQLEAGAERDKATELLGRSLNDSFEDVRREAFKAALNMQIGGDEESTLRFVQRSLHSDVRLEVLTEVMAQHTKAWAWTLLLDIQQDPDSDLRTEALDFALKKARSKRAEVLRHALTCIHVDIRVRATQALAEKPAGEALDLLVAALDDDEERVRGLAIKALMEANVDESLVAAMSSKHADVRLQAAVARADQGDERALAPLVTLAEVAEPENSAEKKIWKDRVTRALDGLAKLGHPGSLTVAAGQLSHADAKLRRKAAQVLVWSSRPDNTAALTEALRHQDADVRRAAASGLAFCGDPIGMSILFDKKGGSGSFQLPLAASVALGDLAEDHFISFLDSKDEKARRRAFLLLMMREARETDGIPDRCLAALSSAYPRVRLGAARALEAFSDTAAFQDYLVALFRHRGQDPGAADKDAWDIPEQDILDLADAVTWGAPQLQARVVLLLGTLDKDEVGPFKRRHEVFARRNADALASLRADAKKRGPTGPRASAAELGDLVFGAYVGLSRQGIQSADARIRLTAVSRLNAMVQADKSLLTPATSVFILALRDGHQPVRQLAFESLRDLGANTTMLGSEALSVGQIDVGVMGMKLLTSQGNSKDGQAVLERVMLQHDDGLEKEAAGLLAEQGGWVPVLTRALEANSTKMRTEAVAGLSNRIAGDKAEAGALDALKGALGSRYRHVRFDAALHLSNREDASSLDVLGEMLSSDTSSTQRNAINALARLREERIPGILLDRLDNDPAGSARTSDLLKTAGNFRDEAVSERLLAYMEDSKRRSAAFTALLTISGYDQRILDAEDEGTGEWVDKQHPRRDALIAKMGQAAHRLGEPRLVRQLIPGLTWARSSVVDPLLGVLTAAPDDGNRQAAVIALGWRVRKRDADAEPLVKGLEHPDPITRFLAAQALARASRKEGLSILMTSVELLENLRLRREAVLALGELADPQALDLLLRLATEEGHALQEVAAEALGHMADSDRADRIFQVLSGYARRDNDLGGRAIKGLRWYGSASAWRIIRERLDSSSWRIRQTAADQLGHNDDPINREVLAELLRREADNDAAGAAAKSLRRLYGADSMEPDFLFVQAAYGPLGDRTLERIADAGDAGRILTVLPKLHSRQVNRYRAALINILLSRDPLPVKEAADGLSSADVGVVAISGRILGRAGDDAKKHAKALSAAIARIGGEWRSALEVLTGAASVADSRRAQGSIGGLAECLKELIWACGRTGAGADELVTLAGTEGPPSYVRELRRQALVALATGLAGKPGLGALEAATRDGDPELRGLAAQALASLDAKRASGLIEESLGDGAKLTRLLQSVDDGASADALRKGASSVHYQGSVLPHLVNRGDISGLQVVLANSELPESTRLGALEALARIATDDAQAPIVAFAKDESVDEELRKAAWRALRRAKRSQKQQEVRA